MSKTPPILIVDADRVASASLAETLGRAGYAALTAGSAEHALEQIDRARNSLGANIGVVLVDLDRGGANDGLAFCGKLQEQHSTIVPIVMTAFRKVESAIQAMRRGAVDYLLKPTVETELLDAVQRAVQSHMLLTGLDEDEEEAAGQADAGVPETSVDETHQAGAVWTPMPLAEAMKEPEKQILRAALEANGWNRGQTAKQLDINRTTLYKKIRMHRLDEPA